MTTFLQKSYYLCSNCYNEYSRIFPYGCIIKLLGDEFCTQCRIPLVWMGSETICSYTNPLGITTIPSDYTYQEQKIRSDEEKRWLKNYLLEKSIRKEVEKQLPKKKSSFVSSGKSNDLEFTKADLNIIAGITGVVMTIVNNPIGYTSIDMLVSAAYAVFSNCQNKSKGKTPWDVIVNTVRDMFMLK